MAIFKLVSAGGQYHPGRPLDVVEVSEDGTRVLATTGEYKRWIKVSELYSDVGQKEIDAAINKAREKQDRSGVHTYLDKSFFASRGMQHLGNGGFLKSIPGLDRSYNER